MENTGGAAARNYSGYGLRYGQGIKQQLGRINWPVTILMADISHRILKWNSRFYDSEVRNPFVDMVYLACDGANLPIRDGTIDCVFSYGGFESMQAKMTDGLREASVFCAATAVLFIPKTL